MRNSTPIFRDQRVAGRCEAAEGYGRTRRGAVRPKGKRVETERELAVKRGGYAPAKASILQSAHKFLCEKEWYRERLFSSLGRKQAFFVYRNFLK